jgi:transcription elongation factor GreA
MMTRVGYDAIMSKIDVLKQKLKEASQAVAEGILERDFREDSAFSVAVEERTKIQNKINELEDIVNNCIIAQIDSKTDFVDFGKSAMLLNVETGETSAFTIVGAYESDPKNGKISYLSPVGKSMMGARVGDEFEVVTPSKELYWEVLDIFIDKPL